MNDEIQKKDERIRELEERIKRIESFIGLTPSIIEEISKRDNYR